MELRRRAAPGADFTVAMKIEEEALERARWLVGAKASGLDRELIEAALDELEKDAAGRGDAPWAELPIAIYQRLRGSAGQAVGLAAITTLLQSSVVLAAGGPGARQAAVTVVRDLAPAGIACLDAPPHRLAAMQQTLPFRPFTLPAAGRELALYARLAALLAGATVEVVDVCGERGPRGAFAEPVLSLAY
jgi:hypothetical protein